MRRLQLATLSLLAKRLTPSDAFPVSSFATNACKRSHYSFFRKINLCHSKSSRLYSSGTKEDEKCIYLDYNGTTPIDKRVVEAMMPYLTHHFGNPSSSHFYGDEPKKAISKARKSILGLMFSNKEYIESLEHQNEIIFTSCGTEADHLAIHLAIESHKAKFENSGSIPHIITSNVEHPAVEEYLKALEQEGKIQVTYVPVNTEGMVSKEDMIKVIDEKKDDTILVTLMLANNESGALQPVREVADYCNELGILFHTDAAQAVGKVSLAMDECEVGLGSHVDMVTIVGHKFGAPKGIGCLYVRRGSFQKNDDMVQPSRFMLLGGGQEGGRRAGTENVPYIVALGTAADIMTEQKDGNFQWQVNARHMEEMRKRLHRNLVAGLGADIVRENGPCLYSDRLPNTLSVGLKGINSGDLLLNIGQQVACAAGSACHASGGGVSAILKAMSVPMEYARGTLRLSLGPTTSREDIDKASEIIIDEAKRQLDIQ
ncbi:hypothetical protein CTEN210_06306 [Chaetoceros tenuissimus]|uniref:Aminotransferase class V domain-containing protein n=1 Tax=Chaetoceros tenuissimus TaxID=426638 RepID=A0AAD3CS45_9STRA|nr:hypothetical protein CTEN210_06306 [Chaetoceros tenuissimus]